MNEEDLVRLYQRGTTRRDPTREGCVPPEALLDVVEQRGPEATRLQIINHAMACADCREELELLRATRIVRDRTRLPRFGFALAASLVLVAGLSFYTFGRQRAGSSLDDADGVTRSGADDVQLITTGAISRQAPNLVWRSASGATSYAVELRREDGTVVTRATTTDTVFAVPDSVRAGPGSDAYWAVTARLSDGTSLTSSARRIRLTP
jgi:hypothetical protein